MAAVVSAEPGSFRQFRLVPPKTKPRAFERELAHVEGGSLAGYRLLLLAPEPEDSAGQEAADALREEYRGVVDLPLGSSFRMSPSHDRRDVVMIAGPSGSGKSHLAAQFARAFAGRHRLSDPSRIFTFTGASSPDPAMVDLGVPHEHFKIDKAFIEKDPDIPDVECVDEAGLRRPTLAIVDDYTTAVDKKTADGARQFARKLLELGRKPLISVITIHHAAAQGLDTKLPLLECDRFVCFPRYDDGKNLNYTLENYFNVPPELLAHIAGDRHWRGRWVCFGKRAPRYILCEGRATHFDGRAIRQDLKEARKTHRLTPLQRDIEEARAIRGLHKWNGARHSGSLPPEPPAGSGSDGE